MRGDFPKNHFPARPRLIFMGTPGFAVPTLRALVDNGHQIVSVVTQPDRPKGRGKKLAASPVKVLAKENGIEVLQPEKASEEGFCELIRSREPDLIIVVAFGQILKKRLLDIPKWGVINVHASLLPEYRGAAPIQRAILNNETKTGLTVMLMDEGLDTGPILFQEAVPILENETAGHLHDRLAERAGDLMVRSLKHMAQKPIAEKPQGDAGATYAPKIEKALSRIDWNQPAVRISALIRALDPKPGAYTILAGHEIKLFSSRVVDGTRKDGVPGKVSGHTGGELIVETGEGRVGIGEIQYPGKKRLPADDFLRGYSLPEGTRLGK
jgi:methionyl-tRNA formyltransferase